jgi:TonB-linked SusC/RagA family outer membrane protein
MAQGTITGRVTAQGTNQPLEEARLMVVGTSLVTTTSAEGQYTLKNVPAGTVEVRVLRVGYQEQKKPVTLTVRGSATLDFVMTQTIVKLTEVVTTATGERRRAELGTTISTIDAGQKVEQTPVHNMGDLLNAKAPGVTVLAGNMTGASPVVRIRGLNSLSRSNAPIYFIDGIRFDAGTGNISVGGTTSSRLNDIRPEEVETIEIVKGPSAATLYGTDAANGVIVITTKRGRAGATRWTWTGEQGAVLDKNEYPRTYAIWGHTTAAPLVQTRCILATLADGSCIKDSTTSAYQIREPGVTPIHPGRRNLYGAQVSGGTETIRFYVSGNIENELGPLQMPDIDRERLDSTRVALRREWKYPEAVQRGSFRANLNVALSPKFDLTVQSAYLKSDMRLPPVDNNVNSLYYNAFTNPGFRHAGLGYSNVGNLGQPLNGWGQFTPAEMFQRTTTEGIQRLLGGSTASWRPFAWLQNDATVGVDLQANDNWTLCRLNECANFGTQRLGTTSDNHNNQRLFTATIRSTANHQLLPWMLLRSTVGADYLNNESDGSTASGTLLPPGGQTVGSAAVPNASNTLPTATKTLGYYAEEQLALRDRLFITGAVRYDQNTAFGTKYKGVPYPKASISWNVSDEDFFPRYDFLNNLRLRMAYGSSGVQPAATAALRTFSATTVSLVNDQPALVANAIGNPSLKPETSSEFEGGLDTRLFGSRVNLELTYYSKQTKDALINLPIAPSAGASANSILKNLGSVKNAGYEVSLNSQLYDSRDFAWDATIGASHNKNKLVSLGNDESGNPLPTQGTTSRNQPGYPLGGYWLVPFTYNDANNDGLIAVTEVTVNSADTVFLGGTQPIDAWSISTGFDFLNHMFRIEMLGDHKAGGRVFNNTQGFLCAQTEGCFGRSSEDAPLFDQARHVAARLTTTKTSFGYYELGDFWRLREVSMTWNVPARWVQRYGRAQSANLVFGARNLKVWTKYTGSGNDPEANYSTGDSQNDLLTTAPRRYYTVRLNLHY